MLDFRDAVRKLNEEGGYFACKAIQILYNEALYWDIMATDTWAPGRPIRLLYVLPSIKSTKID